MGPGESYGLCLVGGKDLAGITKSMVPAHVPSHWLPYVAVDDVDAAATTATGLGGKVIQPATDIPEVGRLAVVADPQGATFALYKHPRPQEEAATAAAVGSFCWDELLTSDPDAAVTFYRGLFGYDHETKDGGAMGTYHILRRGQGQGSGIGGIVKMPPTVLHPYWLAYIYVEDVDASAAKGKELGGQIDAPPETIQGAGRFSILGDPSGAAIGLYRETR
jgi:hypothetical protein